MQPTGRKKIAPENNDLLEIIAESWKMVPDKTFEQTDRSFDNSFSLEMSTIEVEEDKSSALHHESF